MIRQHCIVSVFVVILVDFDKPRRGGLCSCDHISVGQFEDDDNYYYDEDDDDVDDDDNLSGWSR